MLRLLVVLTAALAVLGQEGLRLPSTCPRDSRVLAEGLEGECKHHRDCPKTYFCYREIPGLQGHCCQGTTFAISEVQGKGIHGVLKLVEGPAKLGVRIYGKFTGLSPGFHGFHVHAYGDVTGGCASTGPHFNPFNVNHGARDARTRHVGDLGNIRANRRHVAEVDFVDTRIKLTGRSSIVGRAFVVHELEDDLGKGGNEESLRTGNAGSRLACGIIGFAAAEK